MSDQWSLTQSLREDILEAVELGDHRRVKELLDKGADVNESVGAYLSGKTLLTLAAEKGHEDVAELLINRGANLDVKINNNIDIEEHVTSQGMTSLGAYIKNKRELNMRLQASVKSGDVDGVTSSLTAGAHVNLMITDEKSTMNLLLLALTEGQFEVAKILINNNIDLNHVVKWEDGQQDTALSYSERMGQPEIVQLIKMKEKDRLSGNKTMENNEQIVQPNTTSVSSEVVMDDVDAEQEFQKEAEADAQAIQRMNAQQTRRGKQSTSCIIT